MAVALHLMAKIHSCGKELVGENPFSLENLMLFEQAIKDEDTLNRLVENEHLRWNAFVRSEGFRKADFETVKSYAKNTGSHKDETAKLHPCIVSFDELDTIQKQYDALRLELDLQPNNFKENDNKIVLNLSKIVLSADSDEENH